MSSIQSESHRLNLCLYSGPRCRTALRHGNPLEVLHGKGRTGRSQFCQRRRAIFAGRRVVRGHQYVQSRSRDGTDRSAIGATVEGVVLGDIEPNNIVYISIPYSGSPQGDVTKVGHYAVIGTETQLTAIQARVHLTYDSQTRPGQMRSYDDIQTIATGLPLTVNVQDFFRPEWYVVTHSSIAGD